MTITEQLITWISREVLEGADVGLTESTPLLELGLINSLTVVRLNDFASSQFGVRIPHIALTPQNLSSIRAIADLVTGLRGSAGRV
ncbi:MAG: acyl carrier protein [Kofleriaceae bacterium]